jgi:hypothetical protein
VIAIVILGLSAIQRLLISALGDPPGSVLAVAWGVEHDLGNMSAPSFQCVITLVEKIMALIDCGDARDRSGLVIENFIGDVRRDAEAGHPGYADAPQIVKTPGLYA